MINAKAVVCEVGDRTIIEPCYAGGISPAPYDGLIDLCQTLASDDDLRLNAEEKSFNTIQLMPQSELMAPLLVQ